MVRILLSGCMGRMGLSLTEVAQNRDDITIVAGVDASPGERPYPVFSSFDECDIKADVVIDFSYFEVVPKVIAYGERTKTPLVLCTTGLTEKTQEEIQRVKEKIAIFQSYNMSLGVNVVLDLLKLATQHLAPEFEIEIFEKHHNKKVDAPSGTALLMANTINETLPKPYNHVYDRSQSNEKRKPDEIGITSLRGGNVVGEHSVFFLGTDEVVEIKHTATSKDVFALGAIRAALFLADKPSGLYHTILS